MTMLAVALALLAGPEAPIEVPFHSTENAIIVDATVNGRTMTFMFDTGFSGAFVVDDGINLGKSTGKMTLRDFVGEFQADTVKLTSVKLGDKAIDSTDMEAVVQPADFSSAYSTHCDGIMGLEVMRNQVLEINFEKSRFIFHPKSLDISSRTPDGKKTFLLKMLPIGHNSVVLPVKAPSGKSMVLALDTGNSFYATTHRDVLERMGLWEADKKPLFMSSSFVASGAVDTWHKKLDNMLIFGVPVPTSYWDIIDLPSGSAESDGTVGHGFLKHFNIILDYDRRRVWLDNFSGSVSDDPPGECGIKAAYDPRSKKVIVAHVSPDSPAEKAGVKLFDQLLSVDGKEILGALGYKELESMIDGKVGTKVSVSLSRRGELIRLDLDRKPLVND